jgi:hypothetical protein
MPESEPPVFPVIVPAEASKSEQVLRVLAALTSYDPEARRTVMSEHPALNMPVFTGDGFELDLQAMGVGPDWLDEMIAAIDAATQCLSWIDGAPTFVPLEVEEEPV